MTHSEYANADAIDALATLLGLVVTTGPTESAKRFRDVLTHLVAEAEPGSTRETLYKGVLTHVSAKIDLIGPD